MATGIHVKVTLVECMIGIAQLTFSFPTHSYTDHRRAILCEIKRRPHPEYHQHISTKFNAYLPYNSFVIDLKLVSSQ